MAVRSLGSVLHFTALRFRRWLARILCLCFVNRQRAKDIDTFFTVAEKVSHEKLRANWCVATQAFRSPGNILHLSGNFLDRKTNKFVDRSTRAAPTSFGCASAALSKRNGFSSTEIC